MGDVADMMINGDLCTECGVYISDGDGYPRRCRDCRGGRKDNKSKSRGSETGKHRRYRGRANKGTARRKGV